MKTPSLAAVEIRCTIVYVLFLMFFTAQYLLEFWIVREDMSLDSENHGNTFVFYILLFYNIANVAFVLPIQCCDSSITRNQLQTRSQLAFVLLQSIFHFLKSAVRIFALLFIGLNLMVAMMPYMILLFMLYSKFYSKLDIWPEQPLKATIMLFGSCLCMLPVFIENNNIYQHPAGPIMLIVWILLESWEWTTSQILQSSMLLLSQLDKTCCCSNSQLTATNNISYFTIFWWDSIVGIFLSLIGLFLFEVDQYKFIFDDGEAVGYVSIMVFTQTLANVFFLLFMSKFTKNYRTRADTLWKSLMIGTFVYPIFSIQMKVWHVIFMAIAYCNLIIYFIIMFMVSRKPSSSSSSTTTTTTTIDIPTSTSIEIPLEQSSK